MLLNIVALATLVIGVANIIHRQVRGHRLFIWPTGNLSFLLTALVLAQPVLAMLKLAGLISAGLFAPALCGTAMIQCAYSIYHREHLNRKSPTPIR